MGHDQLSIHFTRLLDYLKSSDIFCPRKLFWAKIPLPEKALQKIWLDFCLKNQSYYRRNNLWNLVAHSSSFQDLLALSDQEPYDDIVVHGEIFLQTIGKWLEICY